MDVIPITTRNNMKKKCSCKGLKPSCYKCDGTGYYDVEKPRTTNSVWPWIQKPPKTIVINTNNPRKKKQKPNKNIWFFRKKVEYRPVNR